MNVYNAKDVNTNKYVAIYMIVMIKPKCLGQHALPVSVEFGRQ